MLSNQNLSFALPDGQKVQCAVQSLVNTGFAGRDRSVVESHIQELKKLGVPVPTQIPSFYPVSSYLAIQTNRIQAQHAATSGEVEYVVFMVGERIYITVGSDHSDREIERTCVPLAKQACANVLASQAWDYTEIADHWDQIQLRSWLRKENEWHLYQDGSLSQLWKPDALIERWLGTASESTDGLMIFSGTLPTIGGLQYGSAFRFELADAVRGRSIMGEYEVEVLPPPVE
ncbi:MAG: DUF2848 family protein [Chloroflexota bacterium]|jgi:hypothetical protein